MICDRSNRVAFVLLIVGVCLAVARAQDVKPAPPTALILGRVVEAESGRPVSGGVVTLIGPDMARTPTVLTDARGRYLFRDVKGGRYTLNVRAAGYLPGAFGRQRVDGGSGLLVVPENGRITDAEIRMWKSAVITGTVFDELGDGVVEAPVRAMRRTMTRGRVRLVLAGAATTDDRGNYRIAGLFPGDYLIVMPFTITSMPASSAETYRQATATAAGNAAARTQVTDIAAGGTASAASGVTVGDQQVSTYYGRALSPSPPKGGRFAAYLTTFHPDAASPAGASVLRLTSGEERVSADVRIRLIPTFRVAGTATASDGPVANLNMRLFPAFASELAASGGFETAVTSTDGQGRFAFVGVPPGAYVVRALRVPRSGGSVITSAITGQVVTTVTAAAGTSTEPTLSGEASATVVDRDLSNVSISLRTGLRVSGQIEFDGATAAPAPEVLARLTVALTPVESPLTGFVPPGLVDRNGHFQTSQYPPGRYALGLPSPARWSLKSIVINGQDFTDRPLDLTDDIDSAVVKFIDKQTQLSGAVQASTINTGRGISASVVVFPADHALWIASGMSPRRVRLVEASASGGFDVSGLPAGDYFLVAFDAKTSVDLQNPADIETLARVATRVTLTDGESQTISLTVRPVR